MEIPTLNPSITPQSPTPTSPWLRAVDRADRVLGFVTEVPAAVLVLLEILVLFWGVVSRYVIHSPLTWSDELAAVMFLWLAMLGSVIAFRRAAHMRMTAIVDVVSHQRRAFLELFALVATATFLILAIYPAYEFALDEIIVTSPSLEISNAWRASALPCGITFMVVAALLQFAKVTDVKRLVMVIGLSLLTVIALYLLSPIFQDLGNFNLLIFFVVIVALLVLSGVPIAFAFGLATFGYIALTTSKPTSVIIGRMDEGMSHLVLLSVPLFVFLGVVLELSGMAKAMVHFLASLLGHVRGGLSYVMV